MDIQVHESSKVPKQVEPKEDFTETRYNKNVKNQRQRNNFESAKEAHHIQKKSKKQ